MDFKLCLCAIIVIVWPMTWPDSAYSRSDFLKPEEELKILKFGAVANMGPDLTEEERFTLMEFKAIVDAVTDDLPKEESYDFQFLLKFLSSKNFIVDDAVEALVEHMAWREDRGINSILEQDWSDMEERYPYEKMLVQLRNLRDGVALYFPLGRWDTRNFTRSSQQPSEESIRFIRYAAYKMMEDATRHARVVAAVLKSTGRDSSKFHIIVDVEGSGYEGDVDTLLGLVGKLGHYYKESTDHFILINVPNFPDFICSWLPDGSLSCPDEPSNAGESVLEGQEVLNEN